mmetsp:Transcript_28320/g.79600  ORF Transcript_28320/g.79600 Transcript_28320/m.79600 type:complete len:205 (+) Transcript_28320:69-683(+)
MFVIDLVCLSSLYRSVPCSCRYSLSIIIAGTQSAFLLVCFAPSLPVAPVYSSSCHVVPHNLTSSSTTMIYFHRHHHYHYPWNSFRRLGHNNDEPFVVPTVLVRLHCSAHPFPRIDGSMPRLHHSQRSGIFHSPIRTQPMPLYLPVMSPYSSRWQDVLRFPLRTLWIPSMYGNTTWLPFHVRIPCGHQHQSWLPSTGRCRLVRCR